MGEESIYAFRLEFDCTNNVAKHEALLLGLEIARDLKVKCLSVIGDFDLIVSQVRNQFATKNDRLRSYQIVVLDSIEMFDVFSIKVVPREENTLANALSVTTCTFEILECLKEKNCKVEVLFSPFVLDNQDHCKFLIMMLK